MKEAYKDAPPYPRMFSGAAVDVTLDEILSPKYLDYRNQNGDDKLDFLLHVCHKHSIADGIEFLLNYPLALNLNKRDIKKLLPRLKRVVEIFEKVTS